MLNNKRTFKKYNQLKRKKISTFRKKLKKSRTFNKHTVNKHTVNKHTVNKHTVNKKIKNNKSKGRSVRGNRQLTEWLKKQGSLSFKIDGKTIDLKINDEIIDKIDKVIKDEYQEQVNNKKKLVESLKPYKDVMNKIGEYFMDSNGRIIEVHILDLLKRIDLFERYSLENFTKEEIHYTEDDAKDIKDDIIEMLKTGIQNERIAEDEIEGYDTSRLRHYEELYDKLTRN